MVNLYAVILNYVGTNIFLSLTLISFKFDTCVNLTVATNLFVFFLMFRLLWRVVDVYA